MAALFRILELITAVAAAVYLLATLYAFFKGRELPQRGRWLPVLLICLWPSLSEAACTGSSPTWTAASADRLDVLDCVNSAVRGSGLNVDQINVPAGSATWTSSIDLTKGMKIVGAGVGQTIITLSGSSTKFITFSPDATALANDELFKYSGFEIDGNNATINFGSIGGAAYTATKAFTNWIITNNKFKNGSTASNAIVFLIGGNGNGQSWGVMSYNDFDRVNIIYQYLGNDTFASGGCDVPADVTNSAYFPTSFGTQGSGKNFYFEHNHIYYSSSFAGTDPAWTETGHGSREVIRYNLYDFTNATNGQELWDVHGQQGYGTVCIGGAASTIIAEIYGNIVIHSDLKFRTLNHRGMWGLYFNNIITGTGGNVMHMTQYDWGCQAKAYTDPTGKPNGEIHHTYLFNNTLQGSEIDGVIQTAGGSGSGAYNHDCAPVANTTFWNQASSSVNASPCTTSACTAGVGRATSAPTGTCTAGTAMWVASTASPLTGTDGNGFLSQANIDIIQAATLYLCESTDTWVVHFTPYTDPHPLNGSPAQGTSTPSPTIMFIEWMGALLSLGWHFRRAIVAVSLAGCTLCGMAGTIAWNQTKSISYQTALTLVTSFNERLKR